MGVHHERLVTFVDLMVVVILSTACHEASHARLADHFGDPTPRRAGRITWNPFAHIHPVYTVALPALLYWTTGGFMAAAFTPVTVAKMRNPRLHGLLVALAGPATNLALAVAAFLALGVLLASTGAPGREGPAVLQTFHFLEMAVRLNLLLAVFNFLPIPPLDGSDLVGFVLPGRLRAGWYSVRSTVSMVFVVLLLVGGLDPLLGPVLQAANGALDGMIRLLVGVTRGG